MPESCVVFFCALKISVLLTRLLVLYFVFRRPTDVKGGLLTILLVIAYGLVQIANVVFITRLSLLIILFLVSVHTGSFFL